MENNKKPLKYNNNIQGYESYIRNTYNKPDSSANLNNDDNDFWYNYKCTSISGIKYWWD